MTMQNVLTNQNEMPEKKLAQTQNVHGVNASQVVGAIELIMNLKFEIELG